MTDCQESDNSPFNVPDTAVSERELVEPVWRLVSIYDGPEQFDADLDRCPKRVAQVLCVHWCNSEVRNGGYDQFFFNATGVLAPQAVEGYRAVGRDDLADLLQQAMDMLGTPYPRERDARVARLDSKSLNSESFRELEDQYYELIEEAEGRKSLRDQLDDFARRGP